MKKTRFPSGPMAALLLLSACGGGYKTDFAPPTGEETYAETFPADIAGTPMKLEPLDLDPARYRGAVATYGPGVSLTIVQCADQEAVDAFVNDRLRPGLKRFSNRSSGKFNGFWSLRGRAGEERLHGWQNRNWLFVIEAPGEALFDEAVEKHPYIGKE